jgi:hypothetical protein
MSPHLGTWLLTDGAAPSKLLRSFQMAQRNEIII